jgi:cell division protein ZapA (FtsZ GTPase activity inhibitor)
VADLVVVAQTLLVALPLEAEQTVKEETVVLRQEFQPMPAQVAEVGLEQLVEMAAVLAQAELVERELPAAFLEHQSLMLVVVAGADTQLLERAEQVEVVLAQFMVGQMQCLEQLTLAEAEVEFQT